MYFVVDVLLPFFSVKELAVYQVASSTPLPPPSSIIGAVGAALGRAGRCRGVECLDLARGAIKIARPVAVGHVAKSSVVLRRVRGVLEKRKLPESFRDYVDLSDAMSREYVYMALMKLLLVGNVDAKVLYLIDRLGDSESLVSVVDVRSYSSAAVCDGGVNVPVVKEVAVGGNYTLVKMSAEDGSAKYFALPVVRSFGDVYKPTVIQIGGRKTLCVEDVKFPDGLGW